MHDVTNFPNKHARCGARTLPQGSPALSTVTGASKGRTRLEAGPARFLLCILSVLRAESIVFCIRAGSRFAHSKRR